MVVIRFFESPELIFRMNWDLQVPLWLSFTISQDSHLCPQLTQTRLLSSAAVWGWCKYSLIRKPLLPLVSLKPASYRATANARCAFRECHWCPLHLLTSEFVGLSILLDFDSGSLSPSNPSKNLWKNSRWQTWTNPCENLRRKYLSNLWRNPWINHRSRKFFWRNLGIEPSPKPIKMCWMSSSSNSWVNLSKYYLLRKH